MEDEEDSIRLSALNSGEAIVDAYGKDQCVMLMDLVKSRLADLRQDAKTEEEVGIELDGYE